MALLQAFNAGHWALFRPGGEAARLLGCFGPEIAARLPEHEGKALALVEDGAVLALGGFLADEETGALGWVLLAEEAHRRPVLLHRTVKRAFGRFVEAFHPSHVACHVRADNDAAIRWAEALGFERDRLLHNYRVSRETYWRCVKHYDWS